MNCRAPLVRFWIIMNYRELFLPKLCERPKSGWLISQVLGRDRRTFPKEVAVAFCSDSQVDGRIPHRAKRRWTARYHTEQTSRLRLGSTIGRISKYAKDDNQFAKIDSLSL